jgi:hypothetical protein
MAADIIKARSHKWPKPVMALVTPEFVLKLLGSGAKTTSVTAQRPALVAYMADLMGAADIGSAQTVAETAFRVLQRKLSEEAKVDAAVALAQLTRRQREQIYFLATGGMRRADLQAALDRAHQDDFMDLINTVCQPAITSSSSSDDRLQLLAPYPALFTAILDPTGSLLVEWVHKEWRLHNPLFLRLKFFSEHAREVIKRCGPEVSTAVLASLARNGIGVPSARGAGEPFRAPATIHELQELPAVKAIFAILNTQEATKQQRDEALSDSVSKFQELSARSSAGSPKADREAAKFLANAGVHILVWLRHIEAHAYIPTTDLVDAGLRVGIVDRAVDAAVRSWGEAGNDVTSDGRPVLPVFGPLAPVLNQPATPRDEQKTGQRTPNKPKHQKR